MEGAGSALGSVQVALTTVSKQRLIIETEICLLLGQPYLDLPLPVAVHGTSCHGC